MGLGININTENESVNKIGHVYAKEYFQRVLNGFWFNLNSLMRAKSEWQFKNKNKLKNFDSDCFRRKFILFY